MTQNKKTTKSAEPPFLKTAEINFSEKNVEEKLAFYTQPIGISEYELSKVYPADFKSTLPSIEDIENELKDKQ